VTLTDRERLALRRVALPTLLGTLTLREAARVAGAQSVTALAALAEAEAWLVACRKGPGRERARRVYRKRAIEALEAAALLDDAIDRTARWAAQFAREMTAVRDAERIFERLQREADIGW